MHGEERSTKIHRSLLHHQRKIDQSWRKSFLWSLSLDSWPNNFLERERRSIDSIKKWRTRRNSTDFSYHPLIFRRLEPKELSKPENRFYRSSDLRWKNNLLIFFFEFYKNLSSIPIKLRLYNKFLFFYAH